MRQTPVNDLVAAAIARRHGMRNSIRIAQEARAAGLSYATAFALVEQESGNGSNVFGHDRDRNGKLIFPAEIGTVRVTEDLYKEYKRRRDIGGPGRGGMQGVGPVQLTWWELQNEADREGGCWKPRINLRVGFRRLKKLQENRSFWEAYKRYNGSGPAAERYANEVMAKRTKWMRRFND